MSKVLIDRELLERAVYRLELAYDADAPIVCDLSSVLSAPSGTPAMPVKAYYHESPNLDGIRTRSVGLEVRKAFIDAPLVLEADALTQIAYLEGEIAKRDARIVELESCYTDLEVDLANDNARLRTELAATKAQEPVGYVVEKRTGSLTALIGVIRASAILEDFVTDGTPLYAAPVSEVKAQGEYGDAYQGAREDLAIWKRRALEAEKALQEERIITERLGNALNEENGPTFMGEPVFPAKAKGVVQWPEADEIMQMAFEEGHPADDASGYYFELEEFDLFIDRLMREVARLNAATVQQVSVPDGATLILGDTGRKDLDRLIDRLMSSDPDFEDCTAAAALLRRLFMEEISGPKGHATWKDAAVAERLRRVSMRPSETVVAMAREGLAAYSGPNMNEHKVCAEIVRLADISDTAMLAAAPAAPAADAGHVFYGMDGNHP